MEKQIFHLEGDITDQLATDFKHFLQKIEKNSPIYLLINSEGGNKFARAKIENFIYAMKKYNNCRFITQGIVAGSAAFRIFVRGDERLVTKESLIYFHISIPNKDRSSLEIAKERESYIRGLRELIPKLSEEEILRFNLVALPLDFMQEKGILTEIVSAF